MSDPDLKGVFGLPFPEQIAFFRNKLGNRVPTQRWDDMLREAHDTGFMVAGAMEADLLADLAEAVDKAIAEGTPFEAFRNDFRTIVRRNGWTGWAGEGSVKGEAWRVRVIYRTNMRTSYMAGRLAQLKAANFKFWVYHHGGSLEPRPEHLSWDGVALPPDHPFWITHYPPSDWGCSCDVSGANSAADIIGSGGDPNKELPGNWRSIDPKTGAPLGIGRGWDYAPGATVIDAIHAIADKMPRWPADIGAGVGASIGTAIDKAWRKQLPAIRAGEVQKPVLVGALDAEDVSALGARGVTPASAEIMIRPGLLSGPKARRHEAKGDAIDDATWERLTEMLRTPRAVLLDETTGKLLLVLPSEARLPQLAVELDYVLKPRSAGLRTNMIVSAYAARLPDLRHRMKNRTLTLLRGELDD